MNGPWRAVKRAVKSAIAHAVAWLVPASVLKDKSFFALFEKKGYHITPVHFYQPVPDSRDLPDSLFSKRSGLQGIRMNENRQLELLGEIAGKYGREYDGFPEHPTPVAHQFYLESGFFAPVDAEMLYGIVRKCRPAHFYEIGSGNTTYLAAQALLKNHAEGAPEAAVTVFDPYPNPTVRTGFPGLGRVDARPVQRVPLAVFGELAAEDILFVDSSHVLTIGGDVQYLFCEVLPALEAGVWVHFHDIFLPFEYPEEWVREERLFWNEQYLLQAFLYGNESFEIRWASAFMSDRHADKLAEAFKSWRARRHVRPASFWMRKTR